MIFSSQIRAARGFLGMSQFELATETGLSLHTIQKLEKEEEFIKKANFATIDKIKTTLENKGIKFTFSREKDENGNFLEIGVKLNIN